MPAVLSGVGRRKVNGWLQAGDPELEPCDLPFRVAVPMSVARSEYSLRASSRRLSDRIGDVAIRAVTFLAAAAAVVLLGAIVWKVFHLAWPAIQHYGLSFVTGQTWD